MISVAPTITDAGKNLLLRAIGGEIITFTRFKIGNGELSETEIAGMLDLINPLVEFAINEIDTSQKGFVKLTGTFDSTYITSDFRWRELGIFCKGEDGVEVLYAYSNDGPNAGMLKVNAADVVVEQTVALVIAVGSATSVTAILSESVLYAPKTEFDAHVAEFDVHVTNKENPHEVTKEQIGLGNVPNVTTNDQMPTYNLEVTEKELTSGEKMSVAFGKIAKAIKSLISHLRDEENPHKLSLGTIGAAAEEHEHSAADITSGALSPQRGGTGISSPTSGGLIQGNGANACSVVRGVGALYSPSAGAPQFGTLPVSMGGTGVSTLDELRDLAGGIAIGEYTGDGASYRFINLGYRPKFVKVISDSYRNEYSYPYYNGLALDGMNAVVSNKYLYTDVSSSPSSYSGNIMVAIVDNGFYVFYYSSSSNCPKTNSNGLRYHYIAGR